MAYTWEATIAVMTIYSLIIVPLLILLPPPVQNNRSIEPLNIPTVIFCDLIQRPDLYDGKEVRFRAKYLANSRVAAFGDPYCTAKENRTWVEFDGTSIKASSKAETYQKVEEQILCGRCGAEKDWRETELLVTGVFDASDTGHGRLSRYRFRVTVKSVEEIGETQMTRTPGFAPQ